MNLNECRAALTAASGADGGCPSCVGSVIDDLVRLIPDAPWSAAAKRHKDRTVREYFKPPKPKRMKGKPLTMEGLTRALAAWRIPDSQLPSTMYTVLKRTLEEKP